MTTHHDPLTELLRQHETLRCMMTDCDALADGLERDPDGDPTPLTSQLARLRLAFDAHNSYEEQLLRPLRLEGMGDDHVHEHRSMQTRLGSPVLRELRDIIQSMRTHIDGEEHYLRRAHVLRTDRTSLEAVD